MIGQISLILMQIICYYFDAFFNMLVTHLLWTLQNNYDNHWLNRQEAICISLFKIHNQITIVNSIARIMQRMCAIHQLSVLCIIRDCIYLNFLSLWKEINSPEFFFWGSGEKSFRKKTDVKFLQLFYFL